MALPHRAIPDIQIAQNFRELDRRVNELDSSPEGGLGAHIADTTSVHGIPDTTILSTLRETVFNVKDDAYGAVGSGAVNDRTAIQAAVDACDTAGGGTVYIPAGTYRLDTPVLLPPDSEGITIQGAGRGVTTFKLVTTTGRWAFGVNRTTSHQTFKNLTLQDFSVDADNLDENNIHAIFSTKASNGITHTLANYEDIAIRRCHAYNIAVRSASGTFGIHLSLYQAGTYTTQNWAKRITIQDVRVDGGNGGIIVTGADASATGSFMNALIDEVVIERCHIDPGEIMDASYASSGVHVGSYATVGSVVVRDCYVFGQSDVGYEINSANRALLENCWAVDCNGNSFYFKNWNYPKEVTSASSPSSSNNTLHTQEIVARDCHVEIRDADIVAGGGAGYRVDHNAVPSPTIPMGGVLLDNCTYTREDTEFGLGGEIIHVAGDTRRFEVRGGRYEVHSVSIPSGGGVSSGHDLIRVRGSCDHFIMSNNPEVRFSGVKDAGASAHTLTMIKLTPATTGVRVRFEIQADLSLSATNLVVFCINIGNSSTAYTAGGKISDLRWLGLTDSGSSITAITIGNSTNLTVPSDELIRIVDCNFDNNLDTTTSIAAANAADVVERDSVP